MKINKATALGALGLCFWFSRVTVVQAACTQQSPSVQSCCAEGGGSGAYWAVSGNPEMCDVEPEVIDGYCDSVCDDCGWEAQPNGHGTCDPPSGQDPGIIACNCVPPI